MLDLLSLPPEIIEKISERLDGSHKKILRGVCKQLNTIAEHQLFSNVVLKYSNYQPDLICEQLEALASRSTAIRFHARSLEIRGFSPDSHLGARSRSRSVERNRGSRSRSRGPLAEARGVNKGLVTHLGQAISSLTKVKEVWWHLGMNDPEWAQIVVMDSLASLPALEDLRISLGGAPASSLKLELLTNLRKITISGYCPNYKQDVVSGLHTLIANSPRLTYLDVGYNTRANVLDVSSLHDLFNGVPRDIPLDLRHLVLRNWCVRLDEITLPHIRLLESLSLHLNIEPQQIASHQAAEEPETSHTLSRTAQYCSTTSEIWTTLREERIKLKEISTDEITPAFLEYVASYSGLEKLTLTFTTAREDDVYTSEKLALKFYNEVLPMHAQSLTTLDICPIYEGKWCFGSHNAASLHLCTKLQNLRIHINSEEIDRPKKDVVWTLLEIASDLPRLSHLSIASADAEGNRSGRNGNYNGNPSIGHIYRVNTEISQSVTTFGPLDNVGVPKVITTPAREYVERTDKQAGDGLWYRSSMSQGSHLQL